MTVRDYELRSGAGGAVKLSLQDVSKAFEPNNAGAAKAVESIDLDVRQGEFLALLGSSGCGKSTLLNLIAGLVPQTTGSLRLDGEEITRPGPERGMLFQHYALFPWQSVRGNIEFGLRYGPRSRRPASLAERDEIVARYITLVGLEGSENKYPHQLSGGMRQRTALARLWAPDPEILLMDEPLAALDAQTRLVMQDELFRIWGQEHPWSERKTVVYVTHSIDEAVFLSDRIAVMGTRPGSIKAMITVDLDRPRTDTTRSYPTFDGLQQQIWDLIRDEAYRATVE